MSPRDGALWLFVFLSCSACVWPRLSDHKKPNSVAGVNVTCTADALTVRVLMEKPFQGLLYARGFPLECRGQGMGENDVTLHLPASRCGVRVLPSEDAVSLAYTAVVEIQMDRHLQQAADQQRTVTCQLPADSLLLMSPALTLTQVAVRPSARTARKKADVSSTDFHQINAASATPMDQSRVWMEIKGQRNSGQVSVGEEITLLIKALLPAEFGTRVTDCVAHDGAGETSQRLLDEWGCPIDELILPALRPFLQDHGSSKLRLLVAGATFAAFKFPDRNSLHLRCILQLCRGNCTKVDCSSDGSGLTRHSRKAKDEAGDVVSRIEVFNSVEVLAPGIELDDLDNLVNLDDPSEPSLVLPQSDRAFCLSPPKMALAFGVLGLVFLCAVAVALYTLLRGHRNHYHSKTLLGEETLIVQDSPFMGHRIQWPHIRIMH
ncbi:uncharacterized protein LOC110830139 isoform X4 [Zootermopsis nevadensis]|uniref:uncharacterized protein LOC110830139 isoform X3 n=1 Tax=Zootermopsis nevadensis TaxID=136037 RepID=UPI000B8E7124|nr:uncharacterized protein LOC110830139 isoform X3 [Zootermopsis nevadensis]XP_021920356.1 uncharacterized protein LOC110830139 isoform X4 [Zootermopsis nevadensis]